MKKSLLALAVAALATASTVSATTVYDKDGTTLGFHGRVQSVFYSDKASGVTDEKSSVNTSARFGIDLRTQITPAVAGFAMAEWEAANGNNVPDGADGFDTRLMWVGLDFGKFGSVKFGKFEEAIKYALYATDIFDDWGCYGYSGNDDRREGVIQYQWSGYGVDALISYAFAKDNSQVDGAYWNNVLVAKDSGNADIKENLNVEYSVSAAIGYTSPDVIFGPIAVRAGFATGDFNNPSKNGVVEPGNNGFNGTFNFTDENGKPAGSLSGYGYYDSYTSYAIGASWGKLSVGPYVGVQYSQRKFDANYDLTVTDATGQKEAGKGSADAKVTGYEFAVGYAFPNGVQVRTGYQTQKYENFDGEDAKSATIPVYVNWNLTSLFQVWGEARFDAGTDDSKDGGKNFSELVNGVYGQMGENVFSAGIRFNF